jgi:hypothetical protein
VFLAADCCLAVINTNTDFKKYGFCEDRNMLIERAIWGYRLSYSSKRANTYAYVLAQIPQTLDSGPETEKITFRFKARLYPVAPNTQDMFRVIKAFVKTSLGKTKARKHKSGIISSPSFVVSARNSLNRKLLHRSFPVQYVKLSEEAPEKDTKDKDVTILFRDSRLLPLNLFSNQDIEVTFDYKNKIVCFNSNGNKVIIKDNVMQVWNYYGLATLFSTLGVNRTIVIALEYEFSSIKIVRNIVRMDDWEMQSFFPRYKCSLYQDLIEKEKDVDAMYCLAMNYYEGRGGADKDYYKAFEWLKKAAMKEHVFAQYRLGLCYLYGLGTKQNNQLAWKWLQHSSKYFYDKAEVAAAQCIIDKIKLTHELNRTNLLQSLLGPAFFQGNANACFLQSYCAHYDVTKTGVDYLDGFKDAARRGHPKAYYYLGLHFEKNKRTLQTAFKCYEEAAKRGFAPAFVKLGSCYQSGTGTETDLDEAFKWFEKASDANVPEGIFKLACCYLLGQGVKENRERALKLFRTAALKSSPRALIALLLLQENDQQSPFFRGDDKAANDESKNRKNSSYSSRRAICLKYGIGTPESKQKALVFLQRNSKYNHWMAFELADSYETGRNNSRDLLRAINLYKNAAAKGDYRAAYRLAKLYQKLGNRLEMMLYYEQAVKMGSAQAAFELAELTLKEASLSRVKRHAKAFTLFKEAAKNGHIRAWYKLGEFYYNGQGVKKNTKRAAECWKRYESAFIKQQNNSIHGLYWNKLPYQVPIKYDSNGLPLKYHSDLQDKAKILYYYKRY